MCATTAFRAERKKAIRYLNQNGGGEMENKCRLCGKDLDGNVEWKRYCCYEHRDIVSKMKYKIVCVVHKEYLRKHMKEINSAVEKALEQEITQWRKDEMS